MTILIHLLFHVPMNSFPDDLLYDFPRAQREAIWPIVPQIPLPALYEDGCNICLSSVTRDLP